MGSAGTDLPWAAPPHLSPTWMTPGVGPLNFSTNYPTPPLLSPWTHTVPPLHPLIGNYLFIHYIQTFNRAEMTEVGLLDWWPTRVFNGNYFTKICLTNTR